MSFICFKKLKSCTLVDINITIIAKNIKYLICYLSLFASINANAQSINSTNDYFYIVESIKPELINKSEKPFIDSILTLYHKTKNDTVRISLLTKIIESSSDEYLWNTYNDYLLDFCSLRLEEKGSIYGPKEIRAFRIKYANSMNNKGYLFVEHGKTKEALDIFYDIVDLQIKIGDKAGLGSTYNNIGYVYAKQGLISKALEYYEKCYQIFEKSNDKGAIAHSLNNIGTVYKNQREFGLALEYFNRTLVLRESIGDKVGIAKSLGNLGNLYAEMGRLDTALFLSKKSLNIKIDQGDFLSAASTMNSLGQIYIRLNKFDTAIYYFEEALKIDIKNQNTEGISISYQNLANLFLQKNDLKNAKEYSEKALILSKELGYPQRIQRVAEVMLDIYIAEKNYKKAFEMQNLAYSMRDSVINQKNKEASIKEALKYDYEKRKHELEVEKEKQQTVFEEKTKRDILIIIAISVVFALSLFFLVFVFIKYRQSKKQQNLIDSQKEELQFAYEYLSVKNTQVMDSINYAKKLQQALMASESDLLSVFPNSFVFMKPKDSLSGDFYWCKEKNNIKYCAVVDCTGHGVPGAIISIIAQRILDKALEEMAFEDPALMLNFINLELEKTLGHENSDLKAGFDISLIIYDIASNILKFSGAHNYGLYITENEPFMIPADNRSIGQIFGKQIEKNFSSVDFNPKTGDVIYLFTDGYRDQFGGENKTKFYYQNLEKLLLSIHYEPLHIQKESVINTFMKWKGIYEQVDDVCLIGIRF